MANSYDVLVLGGGPGGYVAAIRASQLGYRTVVIEKENLGGICLNWGCIPTKSLIKNAEVFDIIKNRSEDFGITVSGVEYDFEKIIARSREVAEKVSKGIEFLFKKYGVTHVKGFGNLVDKNRVTVTNDEGNVESEFTAEKIIISTGAKPKLISSISVDREYIITSREAMNLKEVPKELIIIGAGAIGVEFAYFYNVLGSKVTIVEMQNDIVPVEDKEVSTVLARSFKKRKMKLHTSSVVNKAEVVDGKVKVIIEKNGKQTELLADKVLNAIGVTGNIEGFGLDKLGIEIECDHIKVDKNNYQTNIEGIYAIGDVIGAPWLAHVASAEGIHCVETFHGKKHPPIDYDSIPGCTYCQPQIGSVGLTESKAIERGYHIKIGKFPFSASGKSAAIGEREGFVKIIFDAKYGEILGAHIVGAEATELIAEIGIAKTLEADFESIVKTIHAHPTLSEAIMEAAANAYGESIHI